MANPALQEALEQNDRVQQRLIQEDRFAQVWEAIKVLQDAYQLLERKQEDFQMTSQVTAVLSTLDDACQRIKELERRFESLLAGIQGQGLVIPLDVKERKPLEGQ